ncbi:MAG: hypothetical protein ACKE51_03815 [Methylococcaceae bacterium]
MTDEVRKSGIQFLKNMGRHAELILDTYLEGVVPIDYEDNQKVIETLIQQQVLWRPTEEEGLHLTQAVRNVLEQGLKDERNRQLDINMGSAIATIKTLIGHYKEAQSTGNYRDASAYLRDIGEHVFTLIESLRRNVHKLWTHINNEFGRVGSLSAKIRENELAQEQVATILLGLGMFDFKDLAELSGANPQLRKLLIVNLQLEIDKCVTELSSAQKRLFRMLGHFKEIRARTALIRGFQVFTEAHLDFQPPCYPEQTNLSSLFNMIAPFETKALLNTSIEDHGAVLTQIVQSIKVASVEQAESPGRQARAVGIFEMPEIDIEDKPETVAVENFLSHVIDTRGQKISALSYFQMIDFVLDEEFWLFAVFSYMDSMNEEESSLFNRKLLINTQTEFTGNQFIEDVEVWID